MFSCICLHIAEFIFKLWTGQTLSVGWTFAPARCASLPVNTLQHNYCHWLCPPVSHGSKTRHDTISSFSSDGSVRARRGAVTWVTRSFSPRKPSSRGAETPRRVSSGPALFFISQSSQADSRLRCSLMSQELVYAESLSYSQIQTHHKLHCSLFWEEILTVGCPSNCTLSTFLWEMGNISRWCRRPDKMFCFSLIFKAAFQ